MCVLYIIACFLYVVLCTKYTNKICLNQPKGQGQIMYFLVNASHPKRLDIAASNFAAT